METTASGTDTDRTVTDLGGHTLKEVAPTEMMRDGMRFREFARTGEYVSVIGLGGHHIGLPQSDEEAVSLIRSAIDEGVTFLDNCWDYNNGRSEERMGRALREGYRDRVFLMTKIDGRTKEAAAAQIDESLRRLQTDHVDLLQFHEIIRLEDPDRIFGPGGAYEAVAEARQAGKLRYIGFSGHKDPYVHLRMLEVAMMHGVHFDAVQLPLNVMDAHFRSFERHVLPELLREGVAVLGMKSLGAGNLLRSGVVCAEECLRYALSLSTTTVICGMENADDLKQDLFVARRFTPLSLQERAQLLRRTAQAAARGEFEGFKTTNEFDATAQHPEYLGSAVATG